MINEAMLQLTDLIKSVPEFTDKPVGPTVGGTAIDPDMSEAPLPNAWIVFTNDNSVDSGVSGKSFQQVTLTFRVNITFESGQDDSESLANLAFLESIQAAVRGQVGPSGAFKWKYDGQGMVSIEPDNTSYEQQYSVTVHYK